ncbi:MAG: type II toxin-antitoxin system HigB family toxin [Bacteroidia bacterium]|nr:type II toxin-antitoxin system HigB family toxin [Bacteroidia bacterium]
MEFVSKQKLLKLKKKNRGNIPLQEAVDKLIKDIEEAKWKSKTDVKASRIDADCVHNDGFFFFNINVHRTMVLLEFSIEDDQSIEDKKDDSYQGEASVVWVGTHEEYESTFKNNKDTIEKWLRGKELIE